MKVEVRRHYVHSYISLIYKQVCALARYISPYSCSQEEVGIDHFLQMQIESPTYSK